MSDPRPHDGPREPVELGKPLYSLPEVALITRRPLRLVRRWVLRRQLAVLWLEDGTPCVAAAVLRERLERPPRIERLQREERRRRRLAAGQPSADA